MCKLSPKDQSFVNDNDGEEADVCHDELEVGSIPIEARSPKEEVSFAKIFVNHDADTAESEIIATESKKLIRMTDNDDAAIHLRLWEGALKMTYHCLM